MINISSQATRQDSLPSLLCPADIFNHTQSKTTKVILVRHARSTYNDRGVYQGCSDESVLTEKGQQDAYQTGMALKSIDIDAIYASPLKRVRQTITQILNARRKSAQNIPSLVVTNQLKEINISVWQGLSYKYVQENFSQEYFYWKNSPEQFKLINPTTGQETSPVLDLYQQAEQFWQEILPQHQGETILVVTHGGTNRALINTALGIEPTKYNFLQQSNCGISILEWKEQEAPQACLKALNLTAHIGKTLPKLKEGKQGLRLLLLSADISDCQLQQLAEFWQQESIDFILSDHYQSFAPFIQDLCSNRSELLYLQVPANKVLEVWRKQILTGKLFNSLTIEKPLVTGLVVIDRANLNQVLAEVSRNYAQVFARNCLNIIHYPDLDRHPIFQAITALGFA